MTTALVSCSMRKYPDQAALAEGVSLCTTYGFTVQKTFPIRTRQINRATLISQAHINSISTYLQEHQISTLVWNEPLHRRHHRNLEKALQVTILDRTELILGIFAQRAQTSEEHAQVKLATLTYQKTKLFHAWTHLERQRGSATTIGGPGESQYELDKRILELKIHTQKAKLREIRTIRATQRKQRVNMPLVALVGYTNVGKTSLFNRLTHSQDYVEDKLFATLGTHTKKFFLHDGCTCLLSDTVGFITNFPTFLMNAFLTTLEEIKFATLILHIREVSDKCQEHGEQVRSVIKRILKESTVPVLEVWNKTDIRPAPEGLQVSATTCYGVEDLKKRILEVVTEKHSHSSHVQNPS